jgi:hypothetical protein
MMAWALRSNWKEGALVSFNIREPTNNNAGHSHIIMTESGMRFREMEGFLKTPMTLLGH